MKKKKSKTKLLHQYYSYTGFYSFVGNSLKKAATPVIFIIVGLYLINEYVFTIDDGLLFLTQTFSRTGIIITFFISETLLGLIPPEIFIAWASKSANPWLFLLILATISYFGGIISYLIGNRLFLIPSIKNHVENKIAKHIVNLRKWGGLFVLLGAISPIPHSLVSLASGLIKYNFKYYLMWSLFRYARFVIYALVIFKVFI